MKIIHVADTHFGVGSDGPTDNATQLPGRICDFLDSMDSLVDFAENEKVDLIVIAGDLYHRHSPTPTLVREVGTRIVRAASLCPVVIIPGNHDMPGGMDKASAVDVFSTLRVPNVYTYQDYGVRYLEKVGIQIAAFPAPFKHHLLSSTEMRLTPTESTVVFKDRIEAIVHKMEDSIETDSTSIFMGHFSIDSAKWGSERSMMVGDLADVRVDVLSEGPWDYAAMGHLHLYQELGEHSPVVYSGSLDRIDFSEENDPKGFVLVTIEDEVAWELIEVDARPLVTIRVDATQTRHPTEKVLKKIEAKNLEGAMVRLIVQATPRGAIKIRMDDVYTALKGAGVWYVSAVNVYEQHEVRTTTNPNHPITLMSRHEQLKEYFAQTDMDAKHISRLMKAGELIMQEVDSGE